MAQSHTDLPIESEAGEEMRILMLSYEYPPLGGGGSQVVLGLSKALAQEGCEVDLVTMGFRDLPRYEEVDGIRVHRVRTVRTKKEICYLPELAMYVPLCLVGIKDLVNASSYDINHTHFVLPDGLVALRLKRSAGLKYLVTAHGSDVPGFNPDRFRLAHRWASFLWKKVVHEAEELIFPSRALADLATKAGSTASRSVIPNGFDATRFLGSGGDRVPGKILTVSRLFERKGIQHLFRALAKIQTPHEIHVVGAGPYSDTLRQLASSLALEVRFHGWLDNRSERFKQLLESSSVFVLPSISENFPMVLLEAMAAGLAIVTTTGTGCEEVVGDAALLVPAGDETAIRRALEKLLASDSERRRLGESARRRLESNFGWDSIAKRHIELYRKHVRKRVIR